MRRPVVTAIAVGCALLIAACGSSTRASGNSGGDALAIRFANCMRAHGVSDFPDPGQDNGASQFRQSPAFASASTACDKVVPAGPASPPTPAKSRQRSMLAFAKCMRAHGVPDFPDPTVSLPPNGASVIDVAGIYFVLPRNLDLQAPAVKNARSACGTGAGPL